MYCTFCGDAIDRKTMKCVSCGKPVGSLSTNRSSFQHINPRDPNNLTLTDDKLEALAQQLSQISSDIQEIKATATKKYRTFPTLVSVCCVLVSLLVLLFIFIHNSNDRLVVESGSNTVEKQFEIIDQKTDGFISVFSGNESTIQDVNPSFEDSPLPICEENNSNEKNVENTHEY